MKQNQSEAWYACEAPLRRGNGLNQGCVGFYDLFQRAVTSAVCDRVGYIFKKGYLSNVPPVYLFQLQNIVSNVKKPFLKSCLNPEIACIYCIDSEEICRLLHFLTS